MGEPADLPITDRQLDNALDAIFGYWNSLSSGEASRYQSAFMKHGSLRDDPAAKRLHRAYPGGLIQHKIGVLAFMSELGEKFGITDTPTQADLSMLRIAFCHDLCKVGTYMISVRSQKKRDEHGNLMVDGRGRPVWEDVESYDSKDHPLPLGHGEASLVLAMMNAGIMLSENEMLAIRWHMGAYDHPSYHGSQMAMTQAMGKTRYVILTQTADLMDCYHGAPNVITQFKRTDIGRRVMEWERGKVQEAPGELPVPEIGPDPEPGESSMGNLI